MCETQCSKTRVVRLFRNVFGHKIRRKSAPRNSMMMIAFITTNSGLVPLIEGLCAQIIYFRSEIFAGLRSHLLLFFFGIRNTFKKKAVGPRSHPVS